MTKTYTSRIWRLIITLDTNGDRAVILRTRKASRILWVAKNEAKMAKYRRHLRNENLYQWWITGDV